MELTQQIIDSLRKNIKKSSEAAVAKQIGVSQATVFKWENRLTTNIRGQNAMKLCQYLGIDYNSEMERQKQEIQMARDRSVSIAHAIVNGSFNSDMSDAKIKAFRLAVAESTELDNAAKGVVFSLVEKYLA